MSDDSEDDHLRAPLKLGLQGSRRQGLLGESTPRGGGDGERLQQGSESTTPRCLVERIGAFVHGMQVAEVSPGDRAGASQVREVRGSHETTCWARLAPAQLQMELSQEQEASENVAGEEEVSEQGQFCERSPEKTQSGGKRNLPDEEEREGVGALKRQRKEGGSAQTPTTREGGSVEKTKKVGGVQRDVVLHIHPERILAITDWEDAYNHRSLDEFLVDTIASAMIDCYERKDMRYTKPIFVLAPIVAPPERGEPAVRVLPGDFDSSQPEKYWYYPVCGHHNARAAMKVKDHPVFEYYNFCKWSFIPIYFPHDEFDDYAHVDDPSLKKGKGKPRKGAEEKTYYVQVPESDVHCWKELVDLTDREKKRLLNGVLNLNVVWVQTSSKKLAEQGKFSVKKMVDIIKMDRVMLRLWHYVEFEYEEMDKREWNANSTFFRSKRQLLEEFKDKGLDDKLWNESRKFFTDTSYINKCPQFLGCQHDNNIKRTAALVNDHHFPAEWKRTGALTTLAQFNVDPLSVIDHKEALGKLGHQLRSDTCVLDLCGTVDRAQWDSGAFASLSEDPRLLTHPVYEGVVAEDDAAALRRKQKVTPTDVEEKSFKSLTFADIGNLSQRGALYKDGERNPNQLCNQLLFFCGVADAVLFLGKPHTQVVWSQLHQGRHVLAVDGDTTQLEYTVQYVTHEVSSKAYACDFHHVVVEPVYDPNKDMFFKLTPKKRRQKEVANAVLQGYHRASRAGAVSFIKRLEYVFFNEGVVDSDDFTLDNYGLAFGEDDDFNIETEQEESVEDDLFDLDGQLAIFNGQVSESPLVCKPGTPLATPTSGGPTPVSSSAPVKRGGLSRLRSSPGEPIRLTPQPERLQPSHPVPPDHPHLAAPAIPYHMGDKHTFSTGEDWGHDIVWHPDHFQPVLLDGEWAVAVRDVSGGWIYDDRWDLHTFKSRAYDAVLERLSEVNRRSKNDPALRAYGETLFDLLQSNKWLEVSSAFYDLPSSPSIKQVSWGLPAVTPPAGVVKRKSRGKDDEGDGEGGGQRGTGGGSEQRWTKQRSPGHAGGGEGRKGSREKKKPRSGEKTKHHTGDGQGSDVNRDEDGGVLAVTGSTSMETGNDFRPGWITWPGKQDPVISSTSTTQFTDVVGGAVVAKNGTCFAQLQKQLADCL
ncbi:hypothetical protein CBR_g22121 [Chara braunii]|uniref:Uncharacterized protein n=1 Tax=Chara braunii TaxID=69332 RepID=A0A388L226_CHABU|nr:hypothetical protein CBR_g22121 [Chara braunii]|eukprot:GBG76374.1 hypothetical protein CBR_g22121 [Chara braunii]